MSKIFRYPYRGLDFGFHNRTSQLDPQQSGQKSGLGFPICRIVGMTCLSSGAVLDAVMGSFKGKGKW
jgi:hypothetical protein